MKKSNLHISMCALLALSLCPLPAFSQGFRSTSQSSRDGLSDGSSFYMSRRQYQVVDDSPIVKYSGGAQGPAPSGGFGGAGAPLPRAGFQSYSNSINQNYVPPQNLPKVNNGVPPKPPTPPPVAPPKGPKSNKAKAGKLSSGKPTPQVPVAQGTHAYDSYKGYNPAASLPYGTAPAGSEAGAGQSTATNVKGSVLHWSRRRRGMN